MGQDVRFLRCVRRAPQGQVNRRRTPPTSTIDATLRKRLRTALLSTARELDRCAALADEHAAREFAHGRSDEAAGEELRATRTRRAARRARRHAARYE
jgi:hypothetical protein